MAGMHRRRRVASITGCRLKHGALAIDFSIIGLTLGTRRLLIFGPIVRPNIYPLPDVSALYCLGAFDARGGAVAA